MLAYWPKDDINMKPSKRASENLTGHIITEADLLDLVTTKIATDWGTAQRAAVKLAYLRCS